MGLFLSFFLSSLVAFGESKTELTIMTHDSFSISKPVIEKFEKANGVKVHFLKAGDAGAALNQAILSKHNPLADLFFGVDNSFFSRAIKADIFLAYQSPNLKEIPAEFKLDKTFRLSPVDFGDVCLNYDKKWFQKKGITPPTSLKDLIKKEYKGLTVVQNPATSSPGLAFLLTTIGQFGENGYLDYWKKLRENDVLVTKGWENAYWGEFSAASKGNRPIVVSYASSPPATVYYSEKPLKESPTAAVVNEGTVFRQIEFIGILKGTKKAKMAQKFLDYVLSKSFQEDLPLQMFVFPVNKNATLPKVFLDHALIAPKTVQVDAEKISIKREQWIEAWADTVIR